MNRNEVIKYCLELPNTYEDYREKYHIIDDNCETNAVWIDIDKFKNRELKIYPEQVFKYLD